MDAIYGEPAELRSWGGRLKLCTARVNTDLAYRKSFGSETATIGALCQYEFCLEINSSLALIHSDTETGVYFNPAFAGINYTFRPDMVAYSLEPLHGLATSLFAEVKQSTPTTLKLILFDTLLTAQMTKVGADRVFGKFLDDVSRVHAELWIAKHRWPPETAWPVSLANELKRLRDTKPPAGK
jgi:hypothetical protein